MQKNETAENTILGDTAKVSVDIYEGNVLTSNGAWCWFADPRALHYENKNGTINSTYIGYIDVEGNIKALQYNFLTGNCNEVLIRSYFQTDDHNTPSFLVLPDERIMIIYSRHTDEACFYYRISKKAGDITSLDEELKIKTIYNTTYPSSFILSVDTAHFYLCWRGINWHPTIARYTIPGLYDKVDLNWGPCQIINSTAARPYCKYYSNVTDKIFLAYTTGHPDNEYPNYTYINYVDINILQLKDVSGTILPTITEGPHHINKTNYPDTYPNAVVGSPSDQCDWIWQTTLDKDGLPEIAMVQISKEKASLNYYYARWTGTTWQKAFLAYGGGHFHQTDGLELCYNGGMALNDYDPNEVYCSVPVSGNSGNVYEIVKFTLFDIGNVISSEQVTFNSSLNNIRPYIIANSENSPLRLVWMHGNYYDWIVSSAYPKGFSTAIHSDFTVQPERIDLENGLLINEDFNGNVKGKAHTMDSVLVCNKNSYAIFSTPGSKAFSISLTPCFQKKAFEGAILKMGNLVYGLNQKTFKPYVNIGDTKYNSTNLLGNSNYWKVQNRSTGGKWWEPVMLNYFNLTITYGGNLLTIYRNGLIDQIVEVDNFTPEDIILGEFKGWIEDCRIYNRALNQEEV